MSTLGSRLKYLRKSKDLTQEEFGKIFGVAKSTVSSYENDNSVPDDNLKIKIANFYDISIDFLLGREQIVKNKVNIRLNETQADLLNLTNDLDINDIQKVVEYAQLLKFKNENK